MSLSDKEIVIYGESEWLAFAKDDLKDAIRRVNERLKMIGYVKEEEYYDGVDKIFREEFGEKLI